MSIVPLTNFPGVSPGSSYDAIIFPDVAEQFAKMTGDYNVIHTQKGAQDLAKGAGPIVPGMWVLSQALRGASSLDAGLEASFLKFVQAPSQYSFTHNERGMEAFVGTTPVFRGELTDKKMPSLSDVVDLQMSVGGKDLYDFKQTTGIRDQRLPVSYALAQGSGALAALVGRAVAGVTNPSSQTMGALRHYGLATKEKRIGAYTGFTLWCPNGLDIEPMNELCFQVEGRNDGKLYDISLRCNSPERLILAMNMQIAVIPEKLAFRTSLAAQKIAESKQSDQGPLQFPQALDDNSASHTAYPKTQ